MSLVMARAAGPSGRVHAFEPQPAMAARLAENAALNGIQNIEVETSCLGAAAGPVELFVPRRGISNVGQSSLYLDRHPRLGDADLVRHSVPMTTIDEHARRKGLPSLDLLKIDIEGAEQSLLAGAAATLDRFRPLIVFEANAETQRLAGSTIASLFEQIRARGYALYTLATSGAVSPISPAERSRAETDPAYSENLLAACGRAEDLLRTHMA
jgi:FkbM family methyltransferase